MNIGQQVCSLEQAKRLKELGINQEAYFVYNPFSNEIVETWSLNGDEEFYYAFTVAELGVMLPDGINVKTSRNIAQIQSHRIAWQSVGKHGIKEGYVCYADYSNPAGSSNGFDCYETWFSIEGKTEAQARAAMLIYLLENNLIKAGEVNKRLSQ